MQRRRPAGRHQQRIDRDMRAAPPVTGRTVIDETRSRPEVPVTAWPGSTSIPAARAASAAARPAPGRGSTMARDADAGRVQVERGEITAVAGGVDADIAPDRRAVAVEIGARGRCQHHARAVVAGKHHVPLDRACGEHHALGAHLPQPLARQRRVGGGEMVGDALGKPDHVLRVIAEGGGAREQPHVGHRRKPCAGPAPTPSLPCRRAASRSRRRGSRRAPLLVVARMTRAPSCAAASAAAGRRRRRRPRARRNGRSAKRNDPGRPPSAIRRDPRLPGSPARRDISRSRPRPHEGLVVEAGGKNGAARSLTAPKVEGERRPAVLDCRREAVVEFLITVARTLGVRRAPSRWMPTSAFGSSAPAERKPRGRWYLNERPTRCTPLAISAEASVSPSRPS
jgi:hypothetical protein